jgi:hypothetical protein
MPPFAVHAGLLSCDLKRKSWSSTSNMKRRSQGEKTDFTCSTIFMEQEAGERVAETKIQETTGTDDTDYAHIGRSNQGRQQGHIARQTPQGQPAVLGFARWAAGIW